MNFDLDTKKYSSTNIPEEERIYFNTEYETKDFAKVCHCRYDKKNKLWYTGLFNENLSFLVDLYGVNNITSATANKLLQQTLAKRKSICYNKDTKKEIM